MKIFLLIGQSNMAGRGKVEAEDRLPHARVLMLAKELAWVPAIDPMHFDKPERIGTGLGKTFGVLIAESEPGVTIGLVPAAFGGSALDEWKPGEAHYVAAVTRAREALKHGKLAGILWHQGEADRDPKLVATYPERFARMIAQLRADLGTSDVPVVLGEIGRFAEDAAGINAALAEAARRVPRAVLVSSEGLTDQGDKLHFDSASYREFGRRYARAWQDLNRGRR